MLQGLWTIGIKVPDLEAELAFHRAIGNEIVLDETLSIDGREYRVPLVKMGDKYLHLAEKMVYEDQLGIQLPFGPTHLVYVSDDWDVDVERFLTAGAVPICEPAEVSAGFGDRRVAFLRAPSGWVFEVAKIYRHRVPDVIGPRP
jgi:catechol 2,3-dioxygenase-like lactoylglutathione lyase family enzyme